jgi:site-specific DNA-methyltransferase (adenine-specific)
MIAAMKTGRNSIGVEIDPACFKMAADRLRDENQDLFSTAKLEFAECGNSERRELLLREPEEIYSSKRKRIPKAKTHQTSAKR